jgi:hypothetical protein
MISDTGGVASSTCRNSETSMYMLKQAALNGIKPPRFNVNAYWLDPTF